MAIAMTGLLNSTKASELIRETTGRNCSRQNLESLCRRGRLPKSCVSLSPIRVRSDGLVEEYLAAVDQRQAIRPEPGIAQSVLDKAPDSVPFRSIKPDEELPPYTESQARKMYEQAKLLELERRQKEGLLVEHKTVESAWAQAVTIARTKLLAVPTRLRQRIPHLTLEEIAICDGLIRESLEELSGGSDDDDN